jgi:hypothetical protein
MYDDNQDEMRDHNHEVFSTFFQNQDDWTMEYVQSDDYMEDYACILWEGDNVERSLSRLLRCDEFSGQRNREYCDIPNVAGSLDCIIPHMINRMKFYDLISMHCVGEYSSSCNGYLDSCVIGEYENQIEISNIKESVLPLLSIPNDRTTFENLLAEYIETSRDHCLRGTLRELKREHAVMYQYVNTGLRIEFYLTSDQAEELTTLAMLEYCKHVDRNRKEKISVA